MKRNYPGVKVHRINADSAKLEEKSKEEFIAYVNEQKSLERNFCYKLDSNFVLREIAGDHVIVPVGNQSMNLKGILTLNDSGAFLCEQMKSEKTMDDLAYALCGRYDVTLEDAIEDVKTFIETANHFHMLIVTKL